MIRFWVMELVPHEVGVAHSALPHDETSARALLAHAASQGLHTVVVTAEEGDERAIAVLRELRAEWHTEDGRITAQLDTDAEGQLRHLWGLTADERAAWLAAFPRHDDPNWWMHRLLVLNHHPEWSPLKDWLVDEHVRLFGRPPGRRRSSAAGR
ncbi:hypothetical protein ACSHWB_38145 [Lentzea sp. HUAS TT2]|uniref:hypothetical protein n=1 Tax=Lentzea sp. HUAS TT2 TaxID=3447454 RepID=UPI003F6ECCC6